PPPAYPNAPQPGQPPPPPPGYPNAPPPGAPPPPPPPPHYGQLGGQPEPEIEKGDWDPWEHPTANTHNHDGFLLRLALGFGGSLMSSHGHVLNTIGGVDTSGWGYGASIAIGGAVTENLILNGELFESTVFNPSVSVDGHHIGDAHHVGLDVGVGEDMQI